MDRLGAPRRQIPRHSAPAQSPFDEDRPWRISALANSGMDPAVGSTRYSMPAATAFSTDKDLLRSSPPNVEQHTRIVVKKERDVEKASDYKGQYRVRPPLNLELFLGEGLTSSACRYGQECCSCWCCSWERCTRS